jgi:hypothetical protein
MWQTPNHIANPAFPTADLFYFLPQNHHPEDFGGGEGEGGGMQESTFSWVQKLAEGFLKYLNPHDFTAS